MLVLLILQITATCTSFAVNRLMLLFIQFNYALGVFFCFHSDCTLCNNVVTGRILSKNISKNDILFIQLFQLYRVSSYYTGIKVAYFDHNNEW